MKKSLYLLVGQKLHGIIHGGFRLLQFGFGHSADRDCCGHMVSLAMLIMFLFLITSFHSFC